jgi:hypothetical protein
VVHSWQEPCPWPNRHIRRRSSSTWWWGTSTTRHDVQARRWRQRQWGRRRGRPEGGPSLRSVTPGPATRGGRPVGLGDSTDSEGDVPPGSGAPLARPPIESAVGGCDRHPRDPLTYPTHHTRAA